MLREFRPAFLFLGKFLGIYLAGNVLYGWYIESYDSRRADAVTRLATEQTSWVLNAFGEHTSCTLDTTRPTVSLENAGDRVLNVYEGCNGINVMIVFAAFVVAFGGPPRYLVWFLLAGVVVIHLANIGRISLLYHTALSFRAYFYYVHKYFFTAILYLIVFILWAIWIFKFNNVVSRQHRS